MIICIDENSREKYVQSLIKVRDNEENEGSKYHKIYKDSLSDIRKLENKKNQDSEKLQNKKDLKYDTMVDSFHKYIKHYNNAEDAGEKINKYGINGKGMNLYHVKEKHIKKDIHNNGRPYAYSFNDGYDEQKKAKSAYMKDFAGPGGEDKLAKKNAGEILKKQEEKRR